MGRRQRQRNGDADRSQDAADRADQGPEQSERSRGCGRLCRVAGLASPASHRGGTLTVETNRVSYRRIEPGSYADTAVLQALSLAYDGLVAYRRAGGTAFGVLVGNLAEEVPDPSPDGKTYVFRMRRGIRYSDRHCVRPVDFRAALEDLLAAPAPIPKFYSRIVGAPPASSTRRLSICSTGIVTDARTRTITIHLDRPTPSSSTSSPPRSRLSYPRPSVRHQAPAARGRVRIGSRVSTGRAACGSSATGSSACGRRTPGRTGPPTRSCCARADDIDAQVSAVRRGEADLVVLDISGPLPAGRLPANRGA